MRSTNENLFLWEQRINEKNKSGMTTQEWCKKNGISKNKYHYWNNKINKREKNVEEMTFAEITPQFFQNLIIYYKIQINLMIFRYRTKICKLQFQVILIKIL